MDLSKILAISGHSGLFQLVGQMKNGIVVESLRDGKRMPAYASHKISALQDISIYTYEDDVPLADVMKKIAEKQDGGQVDIKNTKLRAWFGEVLEDFDEERVYTSDIKKVARWYNELAEAGLLEAEAEEEAEADNTTSVVEDAEVVEETTAEEADSDASDESGETEEAPKDVQ